MFKTVFHWNDELKVHKKTFLESWGHGFILITTSEFSGKRSIKTFRLNGCSYVYGYESL